MVLALCALSEVLPPVLCLAVMHLSGVVPMAALDAHVAVLIFNKMVERDCAGFLAQAQAALFSAPPAAWQSSRRKRAFPPGTLDQAPSPAGILTSHPSCAQCAQCMQARCMNRVFIAMNFRKRLRLA